MRLFSASNFVQFLIKICFIPVQLTEDRIVFRFVSWRTLVHVLVYYGWNIIGSIVIGLPLLKELLSNMTAVEMINIQLWNLCYLVSITLPLFLSHGLKNLEPKLLVKKTLKWPYQIWKIFLVMVPFTINHLAYNVPSIIISLPALQTSTIQIIFQLIVTVVTMVQTLLNFFLITIFVNIILENSCFKENMVDEFFRRSRKHLDCFETLNPALESFFLVFYSTIQFLSVFILFKTLTFFINHEDRNLYDYINSTGLFLSMLCLMYNLLFLTKMTDRTFQSMQSLGSQIQERLLVTREKTERQSLKYLMKRVEMLKPLNACGYFDIAKTTLTSMVSVRYKIQIFYGS